MGPTFLYKGISPVVILAVLLGGYLYSGRHRLSGAALESGAIAAAFFAPPLLLNEPSLSVIGMLMVLAAIIVIPLARRRSANALRWAVGGVAIYAVVMLVIGKELGPSVERQILAFRIMDWRDGLMGVAMVVMMVLRPAGIIPERRRGIVVSAVAGANTSQQAS